MDDIPRRTVRELFVRYELEPTLQDVYVEGAYDKRVMDWFLSGINANDVKVYEISTVDIPLDHLPKEFNASGNKGRVIILCHELQQKLSKTVNVICIIDLDFDGILGKKYECKYILSTDYSGMELYLFKKNIFEKFFVMAIGHRTEAVAQFFHEAIPILEILFVMRLAKEVLAPSMTWVSPVKCFRVKRGELQFDWEGYVIRLLNSNEWPVTKERFLTQVDHYRNSLPTNPVHKIHGHDLTLLTKIWINKILKISPQLQDREVLAGLTASIELDDLASEPMFHKISQTCSP